MVYLLNIRVIIDNFFVSIFCWFFEHLFIWSVLIWSVFTEHIRVKVLNEFC